MSSPYISRFLQPDSIIPSLSNPQSWNRYSYVTNRPVNFNDPTGHREESGYEGNQRPLDCKKYGQYCNEDGKQKSSKELAEMRNKDSKNQKGNDPIDSSEKYPGGYCWDDWNSLEGCTHDGVPLYMGEEPLEIDPAEFEDMISYLILSTHEGASWDLITNAWRFDTPFYDKSFYGLGKLPGTGCIDGKCYARHEINYVAQGVLWARVGVSKDFGQFIVKEWKLLPFGHLPFGRASEGTLYWFDYGYDAYTDAYPP